MTLPQYTADEAFVTGTAAEAAPIVKVDGRLIGDGKPGPLTKMMAKAFTEVTANHESLIYPRKPD